MKKTLLLILPLALGACGSTETDVPGRIAVAWCERNHPGEETCLATAREAHARCIVESTGYDACREDLLRRTP